MLLASVAFGNEAPQEGNASNSEKGYSGYDRIVNELKDATSKTEMSRIAPFRSQAKPTFFSLGYTQSMGKLQEGSERSNINQGGFYLGLGRQIQGPHFFGELFYKDLGVDRSGASSLKISELGSLMSYRISLSSQNYLRFGLGLSLRSTNWERDEATRRTKENVPSSLLLVGGEIPMNSSFSLGADLVGRFAMIGGVSDRSSADFIVKLQTYF